MPSLDVPKFLTLSSIRNKISTRKLTVLRDKNSDSAIAILTANKRESDQSLYTDFTLYSAQGDAPVLFRLTETFGSSGPNGTSSTFYSNDRSLSVSVDARDNGANISINKQSGGTAHPLVNVQVLSDNSVKIRLGDETENPNCSIVMNGKNVVSINGGKREVYAEKMSIQNGAAQDVYWAWSQTLGAYVLSTSSSLK